MVKILSSKYKYLILGVFVAAAIICAILSFKVKINYDMTKYLPADSNTKQALEVLDSEFGNYASIEMMVEDVEYFDAVLIKKELENIEGVKSIAWVDDLESYSDLISDPAMLVEVQKLQESFYKDKNALYTILLDDDSYSLEVEKTIEEIKGLTILSTEKVSFRGEALYNIDSRRIAENEAYKIMVVIIPLVILILLLAAKSWIEPIIILLNLGVAIVLNVGTNIMFTDVSYITQTMVMALQLAISLDYSLFLIHRYYEEKAAGNNSIDAVVIALKKTFESILGSALTTITGFAALLFMKYTIGSDLGLVMGKGIVFSFLTTIILMPILILLFSNLLSKTMKKKHSEVNIDRVAKVFYKRKYITIIVFILVAVVGIIFSNKTNFLYASTEVTDDESLVSKEEEKIKEVFGVNKPILILIPNGDVLKEGQLMQELIANENIISVNSILAYEAMFNIPRQFLPAEVKEQFIGDNYTRFIINTNIEKESETMYEFSYNLEDSVKKYYDEYYFAGIASSTTEIKDVVKKDSLIVTLVSIIGVGLVILLIFKSISLPLLLLLVIQSSIWINMSIVYFKGIEVVYIGYLVIQTLQLGATIDYAVLLTSRYKDFRQSKNNQDAMSSALRSSGISIIISFVILAIAGYAEGILSNISAVQEIGILIGRGALLSGVLVLLVLPSILIVFDKIIMKTTNRSNFYIEEDMKN